MVFEYLLNYNKEYNKIYGIFIAICAQNLHTKRILRACTQVNQMAHSYSIAVIT